MQNIIKAWARHIVFACLFGVCMNLMYLAVPAYMMVVYDRALFSFSRPTLYALILGVLISLFAMGILDFIRMRMLGQAGNYLAQKMTPFILDSMMTDSDGIIRQGYNRGLYDLDLLRDSVVRGNLFYILDLPWVLIYLGVLYYIHPMTGGLAISGIFIVTMFQILLWKLNKRQYAATDMAFHENTTIVNACYQKAESISGMGLFSAAVETYKKRYQKILAGKSEADAFQAGIGAIVRMLHGIIPAAVFGAGVVVFFQHEISAGAVFACVIIAARLFSPFEKSLTEMKSSIDAVAAFQRLKDFVSTQKEKELLSLPAPEGKLDAESVTLVINTKTILNNISFSLNPGEGLGILGASASGKTSLCKALLGLWPLSAGKVRLDGAQISLWPKDEFGRYIGYVPQEPELFPATVAQNISRLKEVDSEKVVKAAQKAGAHEMILKLPNGYDTFVQEKNIAASQRQLISIARALYDDPKLVVMDAPHTHLDDLGLKSIFIILNALKKEKTTTIVVTDRINLLLSMDKMLVIREGQVAMYGPSKEVITQLSNKQQPQQAAGV